MKTLLIVALLSIGLSSQANIEVIPITSEETTEIKGAVGALLEAQTKLTLLNKTLEKKYVTGAFCTRNFDFDNDYKNIIPGKCIKGTGVLEDEESEMWSCLKDETVKCSLIHYHTKRK